MKRKDIIALQNVLNSVGDLPGVKFGYAVAKNIRLLQTEIESLQTAIKPSEEYKKYDKERIELVKQYAKKDEEGEYIITNNNYVLANEDAFTESFKKLEDKYTEAIVEHKTKLDAYSSLLEEEIDIELHMIDKEDIPEAITAAQMYSLFPLIN